MEIRLFPTHLRKDSSVKGFDATDLYCLAENLRGWFISP